MEAGGAPFLQATVRDQTEARKQRAASAQTERLASMGLLAASMGHEINNPLAYVLSNLEDLAQLLPKLAAVTARCSAGLRDAVGEAAFSAIVGEDAALLEPAALHEASDRARDALDGARRITRISKALGTFGRVEDVGPVQSRSSASDRKRARDDLQRNPIPSDPGAGFQARAVGLGLRRQAVAGVLELADQRFARDG